MYTEIPERCLKFFLQLRKLEGGVSNNKDDKGGLTNLGITQNSYNLWLRQYNRPSKNVKLITTEEAKQLYFDDYYNPTPYVENEFAHYLLFDLCVNSGLGNVKKCIQEVSNPHNPKDVLTWRRNFYNKIVSNSPTQQAFLKGWMNRLKQIEKFYESN